MCKLLECNDCSIIFSPNEPRVLDSGFVVKGTYSAFSTLRTMKRHKSEPDKKLSHIMHMKLEMGDIKKECGYSWLNIGISFHVASGIRYS